MTADTIYDRAAECGTVVNSSVSSGNTATPDSDSTKPLARVSPLQALLPFVREYSPYYSSLYSRLDATDAATLELRHLPLASHASYWLANRMDDNTVRTGPLVDGVVFKTGGTTGNPKYTALTQSELQRTASQLASGLVAAGLQAGDHLANMFYAGELWGSFLLHVLSTMASPIPAVQIPIGGLIDPAVHEKLLLECRVTAVLSTVTGLVRLAQHMLPRGATFPLIHAVMFGGEAMYPDQQDLLGRVFPNATFHGCIFGSMDAGVIAESAGWNDTRVYRALSSTGVLEICSESGDVIDENFVEGNLVATSWIRRLTPVIRYPTGDRGEWVDKAAGLFRVLGRADLGIRLGPVSMDTRDLRQLVIAALGASPMLGMQAVITRKDGLDALVVAIAAEPQNPAELAEKVRAGIYQERPMLAQHVEMGLIAAVEVRFVAWHELQVNPRTGKQMDVWDRRWS